MKLLKLRFKNLNSLAGEWRIDFNDPAFSADGIFAVTGPTGAGKSTLLDAVCLSLYGRTPRLKVISKTTNEIMSRQTGECFSEVVFETAAGRFCSHWSQRRAHKKADGNLQDAKHEISDAVTGKIIESKKSRIENRIEIITGMDFDRFTRSMLLAQGGFSAFLSATPDERAPILEQLTGTAVYSQISMAVHEQYKEKKNELDILEASVKGINLLSEDELNDLTLQLETHTAREKELQESDKKLNEKLQWIKAVQQSQKDLEQIREQQTAVQKSIADFAPDQKRLDDARKVAPLEPGFLRLKDLRQRLEKGRTALEALEEKRPVVEKEAGNCKKKLQTAIKELDRAKTALKSERVVIKEVRRLDAALSDIGSAVADVVDQMKKGQIEIGRMEKQHQSLKEEEAKVLDRLENIRQYLEAHKKDGSLEGVIRQIKEHSKALKISEQHIKKFASQISAAKKEQKEADRIRLEIERQQTGIEQRLKIETKKVGRLSKTLEECLDGKTLREYRSEHAFLIKEQMYQQKILSLTQHREQLEPGKPCPLCGALEHPFVQDIPDAERSLTKDRIQKISDLIEKIENLESNLEKVREQQRKLEREKSRVEKEGIEARFKLEQVGEKGLQLENELESLKSQAEAARRKIAEELAGYIGSDAQAQTIAQMIRILENRLVEYQKMLQEEKTSQDNLGGIRIKLEGAAVKLAGRKSALQKNQDDFKALDQRKKKLEAQRFDLYVDKITDVEEEKLETLLSQKESELETVRSRKESLKIRRKNLNHEIKTLEISIKDLNAELETAQRDFTDRLSGIGIPDEAAFSALRVPAEKINILKAKEKELENRIRGLQARLADRRAYLINLKTQQKTQKSIPELEGKILRNNEDRKIIQEKTGGIKQQLEHDRQARELYAEKSDRIDRLTKESQKLGALHDLIGSADGKKYRNFAQGLTFEMMVRHANQSLSKMTDRYLLVRDGNSPLELNILDNYQAGEIRSTKNLSGGESFIVSLSLALGLSSMASQNISVDCLFLDEGFGTLDENALETALEVLAGLRQEGKLIGVISHVSAIRQRIPVRIVIKPVSGGTSTIAGPGCGRL